MLSFFIMEDMCQKLRTWPQLGRKRVYYVILKV